MAKDRIIEELLTTLVRIGATGRCTTLSNILRAIMPTTIWHNMWRRSKGGSGTAIMLPTAGIVEEPASATEVFAVVDYTMRGGGGA